MVTEEDDRVQSRMGLPKDADVISTKNLQQTLQSYVLQTKTKQGADQKK